MATTLPSLTRTIDNAFVTTWYEIRPEAIDNILDATPVWAVLNNAGCMTDQEGSDFITRTIRYGETDATEIERGDLLPEGEDELETMAIWRWKTLASRIQRDTFDDQKNRGPSRIKSYIGQRLSAARDGLEQKYETSLFNTKVENDTSKPFQGLYDMVPPIASIDTGTYGGITRAGTYANTGNGVYAPSGGTNPWWGNKYLSGTWANVEDDLIEDMKKLYNSLYNNQAAPDLIIGTQTAFEIYEQFAFDLSQIVKDESTYLADLGFEVLRFKGKPFVWTPNLTDDGGTTYMEMLMLNTDYIECVYDPGFWFDMTDWKPIPLQTTRIAHILCFANLLTTQPRRHGRIEWS